MIGRLAHYVRGAYPPLLSTIVALTWAYGVTGLFAVVDRGPGAWHPDRGTAIAAVTLLIDLLLMRAIDDIRDLDYDRVHSPRRPLPAGVVRTGDLLVLYVVGTVVILALNLGRGPALALIAAQLGYAVLVLVVHRFGRWPNGDNLPLTLLISCPAQIVLHLYLYAGYQAQSGAGRPSAAVVGTGLVVVVLASLHLELAKKIVRVPAPGERTYVSTLGLPATVVLALLTPVLSVAVLLGVTRPPWYVALVLVAPLVLPAVAARRFRVPAANRWDGRLAAYFLLATFVSYAIAGY